MTTLWSGRFDAEPDPDVFEFGASFRFDRRLFDDDVQGSLAWAEALHDAGAISAAERGAIVAALSQILLEGRSDPSFVSGPDEDVHSFVERQLVERIGEAGRRLHTGRSRNEQVSVDLRLYLKRRIPLVQEGLIRLVAELADAAGDAGPALMPAYTHLRRAQPVLVAHFFLAHAAALRRDHRRLEAALAAADVLPLGSGAVVGTNYPIDTTAIARRLGFSATVSNSLDATGDRDFVADFIYAAAMVLVHLSRLAEDLIIFTSEEFGFFELSDRISTGSSLMPQKKNPDPLELVRGKAGRLIGHLTGWLATLKGLPSGYNKDLQEDKETLFDAEDTVVGCVATVRAVVATLALRRERAELAASGFLLATDVADFLVERGMPFRRAHELVGKMVRTLLIEGKGFDGLEPHEWRAFSELFEDGIAERLTPRASVEAKRTPQSTNPSSVDAQMSEVRAWIERHAPAPSQA